MSGTSVGHNKEYRVDVIWYYLQKMRSPVGPNYRFKLLFEVARIVLTIPHSIAGIERVFLLVNKNKNESSDRSRLDIEGSLSSILTVKLGRPESKGKCYLYKPDNELLRNAKKATIKKH